MFAITFNSFCQSKLERKNIKRVIQCTKCFLRVTLGTASEYELCFHNVFSALIYAKVIRMLNEDGTFLIMDIIALDETLVGMT